MTPSGPRFVDPGAFVCAIPPMSRPRAAHSFTATLLPVVVQAGHARLHVLEAHVGVHVGRDRRVCVAKLLLDLAKVPGPPEQVDAA